MEKQIRIALAGNPNSGKTTLFNALTGSNQFVGNWPGVTVEKKEGRLKNHKDIIVTDLPGIYSLSPYTLEEVVARNYLIEERPDVILNIVDATNLERNLYLTTQLVEIGIPVVIALNMMDLVRRKGDNINVRELSRQLGCKVVEISALKGEGTENAAEAAIAAAEGTKTIPQHSFSGAVEHALAHIEEVTVHRLPEEQQRWYAIKIFERDTKVQEKLKLEQSVLDHVEKDIAAAEKELDDDAESIITNERYVWIAGVMKGCYRKANAGGLSTSDKIDRVVTNRTEGSRSIMEGLGAADWLTGLVSDGIFAGVGAVLGFVPQMLVLFLMLCILEDCGYMARIAFIMDRIFRRFGLSGKSFIPMLVGMGCGVPGVMASRTIENERDRRMTIMTTTFIPCGAKMPIIGLIAGALFGGSGIVATSAYFIGIAAIIVSGIMLKKTKMFAGDPAPFVMELPAYHVPSAVNVLRGTWERGWSFIKRAGTVILLSSIVIWFLSGFGSVNGKFGMVDALFEDKELATEEYVATLADRMNIPEEDVTPMDASMLAGVGNVVSPVFRPLGFGSWKPTVATVTGLVAKEEVVGTFGVLYNYDDQDGEEELGEEGEQIWDRVAADFNGFSDGHGKLAAYAFMIFNLLCAPCFAAIGAIRREMNNRRWTWFAIGYQCVFAYAVGLAVFQIGKAFSGGMNIAGLAVALVIVGAMCWQLFKPYREANTLTIQ